MPQFTPSATDAASYRTYLERHARAARERVISNFASLVDRLKEYDRQATLRPEYTWGAHEEMQRSILYTVHNCDLGYLMRTSLDLSGWDQRFPRDEPEETPETI